MTAQPTPFQTVLRPDLPPPAVRWTGFAPYYFVGGNNAAEGVPVADFRAALDAVLEREGRDLATYNLQTGPQGYGPLRTWLAGQLKSCADMTVTADDILMVSGSLQGMDLINAALLAPGDTVVIEEGNYGGVFTRLARLGVKTVPVKLDGEGMCMVSLAEVLAGLKSKGIKPKYIYTIPTVQNPTGTVLPEDRRRKMLNLAAQYDTVIFEDDCYADLVFDGTRPPAIQALDTEGRVVYLGSFSKSLAPALRVGYVVAPWDLMSRLLSLKTDAGSGALEQMMLAEYCPKHFQAHISHVIPILKDKLEALTSALEEHFGTAAEFSAPRGGIFLWVKLPAEVDTTRLFQVASQSGVVINPGREWSIADDAGRSMRICFASPSKEQLREGIAKLARICFEEFGVPERGGNVQR